MVAVTLSSLASVSSSLKWEKQQNLPIVVVVRVLNQLILERVRQISGKEEVVQRKANVHHACNTWATGEVASQGQGSPRKGGRRRP